MRQLGLQRFLNRLLSWSSKSADTEICRKIRNELRHLQKEAPYEKITGLVTETAMLFVPRLGWRSKEKVFDFKTELGGILPELKEKIQELKTMITNKLTTENKITKLPVEFKTIVNELFSLREACSPDSISKENKAKAKELNGRFKMFDQALEKQSQIILKYVISCF
jgi:dGTP triphosphohydrolase